MRLADDLERLTAGIAGLRALHMLDREREQGMTIEIKGLGANVEAARAAIRRARAATAHMNEAGGTLERTANEIAAVFEQHTSDLLREANTMGNGSSESETQSPSVAAAPEVPAAKPTFPAAIEPGTAA